MVITKIELKPTNTARLPCMRSIFLFQFMSCVSGCFNFKHLIKYRDRKGMKKNYNCKEMHWILSPKCSIKLDQLAALKGTAFNFKVEEFLKIHCILLDGLMRHNLKFGARFKQDALLLVHTFLSAKQNNTGDQTQTQMPTMLRLGNKFGHALCMWGMAMVYCQSQQCSPIMGFCEFIYAEESWQLFPLGVLFWLHLSSDEARVRCSCCVKAD